MERTKIVATIGPASNSPSMLESLVDAGMNVARLNFSHGSYETHVEVIRTIRSISRRMNRSVGILVDLQGPKIRVGKFKNSGSLYLKKDDTFCITTRPVEGSAHMVSTTYSDLVTDVKKGDTILLDDGLIWLCVDNVEDQNVFCKVISGGYLKDNKGINLPGVNISSPSLTEKDKRDLNFGIKNGVDFFALSFVRTADDLIQIKTIIKNQGGDIPVIAKIEKPEAIENLDSILEVSDGIMVARGDLGVELKPEFVPTIQKRIIQSALKKNKPVITATQMLETMSTNPIPTRAETSDVANAILDGTDAVMLSGETASGKYPIQTLKMMGKIAGNIERSPFMRYNIQYEKDPEDLVTHAIAQSAVNILHEINAKCIIAFTISGKSAKQISKQRPSNPVYAFTSKKETYNRLSLVWGVTPMYMPHIKDAQRLIQGSENILINKGRVEVGDYVVLVIGMGLKQGATNMIKIHRVGFDD